MSARPGDRIFLARTRDFSGRYQTRVGLSEGATPEELLGDVAELQGVLNRLRYNLHNARAPLADLVPKED